MYMLSGKSNLDMVQNSAKLGHQSFSPEHTRKDRKTKPNWERGSWFQEAGHFKSRLKIASHKIISSKEIVSSVSADREVYTKKLHNATLTPA